MSENETKLRDQINALWRCDSKVSQGDAYATLDALLAEHRAEVERLTEEKAEAERFRDSWRRRWSEDVGTTRDAALEEGIRAIDDAFKMDLDVSAQNVLSALKTQPARQYVDAEKVREVVATMANTNWRTLPAAAGRKEGEALVYFLTRELGARLGVDFSADAQS